jgi:hypothetical protein
MKCPSSGTDRAVERCPIAGVHNSRWDRAELGASTNELLVLIVTTELNFRQRDARAPDLLGGRDRNRYAGYHLLAPLIDAAAVEDNDVLFRPLFFCSHRYGYGVTQTDRLRET